MVAISLVIFPIIPAALVGLAARFAEGAAPLSVPVALVALWMALSTEPIYDVSYSGSGLRLRRWNGSVREVPWDKLACISILLEGPSGASLVFRVSTESDGRDDRFVLSLAGAWQGGLPPRSVIRKLAEHAPVRMTVERRRSSWRVVAWGSLWFAAGSACGLVVASMTGPVDAVAGSLPTVVGLSVILAVANFGSRPAVVVEAGAPPPVRLPRAYRDWSTALAERSR
jgi:hypothetical protein